MKKIAIFILVSAVICIAAVPALAGGDQHHGENGQGTVIQHQVSK